MVGFATAGVAGVVAGAAAAAPAPLASFVLRALLLLLCDLVQTHAGLVDLVGAVQLGSAVLRLMHDVVAVERVDQLEQTSLWADQRLQS